MLYESHSITVALDAGVATLWLDFDGARPNRFNFKRLQELGHALDATEANVFVNWLVIRSAKPAGFSAGFDFTELTALSASEVCEFSTFGQRVCQRIADAPYLTLAVLHGPVLGPGLDLALACDYRLAVATPTTMLGHPELSHGIVPAWGGLSRMTKLLGAAATVQRIIEDGSVTAREAFKLGLVDRVVCERRAKVEIRTFLHSVDHKPNIRQWPFASWAARRVVAAYHDSAAGSAVVAAMNIVPHAAGDTSIGLVAERAAFVTLLQTPAAKAALALHLDESCHDEASALPSRIAVIGPLETVCDLVCESLVRGSRIDLDDEDCLSLDRWLDLALARGRVTPLEADQARSRIFKNCIVAASAEVVLLTVETAKALDVAESVAKPGAVIVAVDIDDQSLQEWTCRPCDRIGLSRAAIRNRVELVPNRLTRPGSHGAARAWLTAIEQPFLQATRHGSIVEPLLAVWWDEAVRLVTEGMPIHVVDAAACSLGARVGPLETIDGLGLESVANRVPRVKPLIAAGIRGRPHSDGFYVLSPDDPTCTNAVAQLVLLEFAAKTLTLPSLGEPIDTASAERACRSRLALRLLSAAIARLDRDHTATAAAIDLAVVRGIGVFQDTGGILRWAEAAGLAHTLQEMKSHRRRYGPRFRTADLRRRAGESFHARSDEPLRLRMSA